VSWFTDIRNRQPTAAPATTDTAPAAAPTGAADYWGGVGQSLSQPTSGQQPWGGFTLANIGQYGYGTDLNPLSQQTGIPRDTLADQRDAFIRPIESSYRTAMGGHADATSANLVGSPEFQQFTQTGQAPNGAFGSLSGGVGPASSQYAPGSAIAPWTQQFQAPTADQAIQTPGLQYALDRAKQAIERSAASKGTLLTGGLLRDLSENQIGMALQGYQQTYNNARSEYDLSRENYFANQDRPFDKYYKLGELGRPV
jgi:hypothetical protein